MRPPVGLRRGELRRSLVPLVVGLLLTLTSAASAADGPNRPEAPAAGPVPVALAPSRQGAWELGHPWAALRQAASLAQPPSQAPSHRPISSNDPEFRLSPLGDVDADGKADLLLSARREFVTLTALQGGSYRTLWEIDLERSEDWFALGDVTGDGIEDLVVTSTQTGGSSVGVPPNPAVYAFESAYDTTTTYKVVSGADGKELFKKTCVATDVARGAYTDALVAGGGADAYQEEFCVLVPVLSGAFRGFDIVKVRYSGAGASGGALVGGAFAFLDGSGVSVQRVDGKGAVLWAKPLGDPVRSSWVIGVEEFTGDGIPDYAVFSGVQGATFVYTPQVDAWRWIGVAPRVAVFSGRDGSLVWEEAAGRPDQDSYVTAAVLDGKGADLLVHTLDAIVPGPVDTVIARLAGATGAKLSEQRVPGHLGMVSPAADLNKDGRGDLLMLRVKASMMPGGELDFAEEGTFGAVDASLKPLWEPLKVVQEDGWEGGPHSPDFNGDGVPEVTLHHGVQRGNRATAYDGATGKSLWSRTVARNESGVSAIADLDGVPGMDLAIVTWEVPGGAREGGMSHFETAGGGDGVNALDYPGFVEVRRGTDLKLVWRKQLHDPERDPKGEAPGLIGEAFVLPDSNGNQVNELVVNLQGQAGFMGAIAIATPEEPEEPYAMMSGFGRTLVLDGADATTLVSHPAKMAQAPATLGEAAPILIPLSQPGGEAPTLAAVWLLVGLLGAAVGRRRQA